MPDNKGNEINHDRISKTSGDESDAAEDDLSCFPRDQHDLSSDDDDMETDDEQTTTTQFDGLESICNILCRCRKMINTINKSNILHDLIEKLCQTNISIGLVLDMRIRWGSTFKMIRRFLDYRSIITQTVTDLSSLSGVTKHQARTLTDNQLSDAEWCILQITGDILEVFFNATEMLSGQKYPALGTSYCVLDSLKFFLDSMNNDPIESSIKRLLQKSFNKYINLSADSPVYRHVLVRKGREKILVLLSSFGNDESCRYIVSSNSSS